MKPAAKPGTETEARAALLRQIPSVDELLALPRLKTLAGRVDRALVVEIARAVLANVRARITGEREIMAVALNSAELEGWIAAEVEHALALSLQPVINATGVILHTNLGRAPLPAEAIEHLRHTATQYSNLEYDLAAGARGKRDVHTARFIERPSLEELVALGCRTGLPVMEDLGSGCLVDLSAYGVNEPVVRASLEAGASVVTFSGDKMLGGPQAGIIAGKRDLLERIRRHPLFRALRVDKLTIAAMEATLGACLRGALEEVPTLRMIRLSAEEIARRAQWLAGELRSRVPAGQVERDVGEGASRIGGGSTRDRELPTSRCKSATARYSAAQLEERLRKAPKGISVITRVEEERLVIDLRTVFPEQEAALAASLAAALH